MAIHCDLLKAKESGCLELVVIGNCAVVSVEFPELQVCLYGNDQILSQYLRIVRLGRMCRQNLIQDF